MKLTYFSLLYSLLIVMKRRLIVAILLITISSGLSLVIPYLFKIIIERLSQGTETSRLFVVLLLSLYGVGWTVSAFANQLRMFVAYKVLERGKRLLLMEIIHQLLGWPIRFHTDRKTGKLTTSIEKAQQGLENVFWGMLLFLFPLTLEFLFVFCVIGSCIGWLYAFLLGSGMLVCLCLNYLSFNKISAFQKEHNEASAESGARVVDCLLNIEIVKYFGREIYEQRRLGRALLRQEESALKRWWQDVYLQIGQMLIIGVGLSSITLYTGYTTYAGALNIGAFLLINSYLLQCIMPFSCIGYVVHQVRKGYQDMLPILDLLKLEPEARDKNTRFVSLAKPELSFEEVSFGYATDQPILKNISFSLLPGTTTAIVGPSGSGKSTITKLIFRFYDVSSGCILLNGLDIRNWNQDLLRKQIGIVPQETCLINDTLYHNIAYGNPDASMQEVYEAARLAQLIPLVRSLPEGYDTNVGERGLKLSGGERQRVAIARLLLRKPQLYIFDEATASLDSTTEQEIQRNLHQISSDSSKIMIAHRLSTIIHADHIIVLDCGKIVEQGIHGELVEANGLYAHLWRKQQGCPSILDL